MRLNWCVLAMLPLLIGPLRAAHAGASATGWRLEAQGGFEAGPDYGPLTGFALIANRPVTRARSPVVELVGIRSWPLLGGAFEEVSTTGADDLAALLVGVELRAPIWAHLAPFVRGACGAGLHREGATRVVDWWDVEPAVRRDVPARTFVGLTPALAVGFGRIPSEGYGAEVTAEVLGFVNHGHGAMFAALALGLVR